MIEYAIREYDGKLVHIEEVENGKFADCICPNCKDTLYAKNQCVELRNHFYHANLEESKSCRMTQLHLAAQHYFLNAKVINLPEVHFIYKGVTLSHAAKTVVVHDAEVEYKLEDYSIDVWLNTDIGVLLIEICVHHQCEPEKKSFIRGKKQPALEYFLDRSANADIRYELKRMVNNQVKTKWLYPWCQDKLIAEYEIKLEHEVIALFNKNVASAQKASKRVISTNKVLLPTLSEVLTHTIEGKKFQREWDIFTQSSVNLDAVKIVDKNDDYYLLKAIKIGRKGIEHQIHLVYLLREDAQHRLPEIKGSFIVRSAISKDNKKPIWAWGQAEKHEQWTRDAFHSFRAECSRKHELIKLKERVNSIDMEQQLFFEDSRDLLFKKDYREWSNFMKNNSLFFPSQKLRNPKIPDLLKPSGVPIYEVRPDYSKLWMFGRWHVLVISVLAEIASLLPLGEEMKYSQLFQMAEAKLGLTNEYRDVAHEASKTMVVYCMAERAMKEALIPFTWDNTLRLGDRSFTRNLNPLERLRLS
ncbi:hypothetical protein [Vibrio splendidus]|uniref:hypothetical protein n=1 Tax=Vibrio splendidus TaxID=29497 RepID=UPI000C838A57|nr:hypothetical protein [Vibrio splendidus]PMJ93912.1 hypothetical protein BCU10_09260 [Vibrio splendidus]